MQKFLTGNSIFHLLLLSFFTLIQVVVFAQDSSSYQVRQLPLQQLAQSTTIQPWMWVVGGAVVLIIIIALLRGSR